MYISINSHNFAGGLFLMSAHSQTIAAFPYETDTN